MNLPVKRGANSYWVSESHHNARLTDHEVELIRQLRADGLKVGELALLFGVSKGYVPKILQHLGRG